MQNLLCRRIDHTIIACIDRYVDVSFRRLICFGVSASVPILSKPPFTKVLEIFQVLSVVWGYLEPQGFLNRNECSLLVFFDIGADELSADEIESTSNLANM